MFHPIFQEHHLLILGGSLTAMGVFLFFHEVSFLHLPLWKYLYPSALITAGVQLFFHNEMHTWLDWQEQDWLIVLFRHQGIFEDKIFTGIILATGIIELLRHMKRLEAPYWVFVLPSVFFFAAALLLDHMNEFQYAFRELKFQLYLLAGTMLLSGATLLLNARQLTEQKRWRSIAPLIVITIGIQIILLRG